MSKAQLCTLSMKIWLDDQLDDPERPKRHTPEGWVGVRNFSQFKGAFEEAIARGEKIEALDFDNDLGKGETEGWEIAKWITETHPEIFEKNPELNSHSDNPAGKKKIMEKFELGKYHWRELIEIRERPHPWGEMEPKIR